MKQTALFVMILVSLASQGIAQTSSEPSGSVIDQIDQQLAGQGDDSVSSPKPVTISRPTRSRPSQSRAVSATSKAAPKIRPCLNRDVNGMFKLRKVFETPAGGATATYRKTRHQYLYFDESSLYTGIRSSRTYTSEYRLVDDIYKQFERDEVRQYILNDAGVLYYYLNRKFDSSWHCGVSRNTAGPYRRGDIILTPTNLARGQQLFTIWYRPRFAPIPKYTPPQEEQGPQER